MIPVRGIPWRSRLAAAVIEKSPDWGTLAASRAMGAAARVRIPRPLGRAAIAAYIKVFAVDMADVDPVSVDRGFDSFDEFFTRPLRAGARPVAREGRAIVSPSDGLIRDIVELDEDARVHAKGHSYELAELIADDELARDFVGGTATTIYLHPRDYHRVHSPCDALVSRVKLVPGRLLPVNDAALARAPGLFAINERMVHILETAHGKMVVVMIAAFGVGHMTCSYRHIDPHPRAARQIECDPPARMRKADELGIFHLGSTVVLVAERGVTPVACELPAKVKMGQVILQGNGER
ncbi:MAG: phosphatidylserine decarboxylase [Myxococcales bacterium]|nr:phosphatidylserine decarboxylase [Myxococcales bacterium]